MKLLWSLIIVTLLSATTLADPVLFSKDLSSLEGGRWAGTLTYRDYSSNRDYSIPVEMVISRSTANANGWIFRYEYPKEPHANGDVRIRLSDDGRLLDGADVVEKKKGPNGEIIVVTKKTGTDNGKASTFRYTYTISRADFTIRKEVRQEGTTDFFLRNEYKLSRTKATG